MNVSARLGALAAVLAAGCSPGGPAVPGGPAPQPSPRVAPSASPRAGDAAATSAAVEAAPSAPAEAAPSAPAEPAPAITAAEAEAILFADAAERERHRGGCATAGADDAKIRCLLGARYDADASARSTALELYAATGDVAGVDVDQIFDGGYRGQLHLVPEPPVGPYRRHLEWVAASARDHDAFFAALAGRSGVPAAAMRYRWRPIALRYFRSVGKRTPSAYATGWSIAYNVSGSLHTSPGAVRETMFHEIFHLNDAAHGGWSARALGPSYDRIVARCGTALGCLRPYAPNETTVKGGTYYAFQPGNGVGEYAAELAIRYYREHRALLGMEPPPRGRPFKCGPEENRVAWALLVAEFFGKVDLVPRCQA